MPYPAPDPFRFAQIPVGFFGRTAEPVLSPIPGTTEVDLERLRSAYAKAGAGHDVLARIEEIRQRRRALAVDATMRTGLADQLLSSEPPGRVRQFGHDAAAARQSLLNALNQRP